MEEKLHAFLTSAPDGEERLALPSDRFTFRGNSSQSPLDWKLLGLQSRSERDGEEKKSPIFAPAGDRNHVKSARSQSLY
jgi:hypothetical protein